MAKSITMDLPDEIVDALVQIERTEGIVPSEFIGRAVRESLFVRRFRTLRDRLAARAREDGVLTDEDVFERVS